MLTLRVDEHVALRFLEPQHATALFRVSDANRRFLREWLPWLDATRTVTDTKRFIRQARDGWRDLTQLQTGLWHDDELVGAMGIHRIEPLNRRGQIGYWIAERHQMRGMVTRACARLIRFGFEQLDLNKLEIMCEPRNHRSRAVPERLGFVQEGTLREAQWLNDRFVDLVVYGQLLREWEARTTAR